MRSQREPRVAAALLGAPPTPRGEVSRPQQPSPMYQEVADSVTQGFTEPCSAGAGASQTFPAALPSARQVREPLFQPGREGPRTGPPQLAILSHESCWEVQNTPVQRRHCLPVITLPSHSLTPLLRQTGLSRSLLPGARVREHAPSSPSVFTRLPISWFCSFSSHETAFLVQGDAVSPRASLRGLCDYGRLLPGP